MSDSRKSSRRAEMALRSAEELEAIASMDCVVPLDVELAELARAELEARGERNRSPASEGRS